ncbi:tRNA pseudouridine(55) synthase TruB [Acidothermaceae bacterium B102]|nr:tRNA pseudouridine(55) synthase TruB [Acidothermaceae bacterium B102]
MKSANPDGPSGLVVVDKPSGWTSFDVVARVRRLAGTRRVGHAGTLDPMATGVLVIGINKATRLLGHLALTSKVYEGTIRLGETTNTDDAEGEQLAAVDASGLDDDIIRQALQGFRGEIEQVPPQVSAIKVDGKRSYARARAGETVELVARPVTVSQLDVVATRRQAATIDLDVVIACTSGTYIRSIARDLGATLGVGGHLTALRRTAVGPYTLEVARTLEQLVEHLDLLPLDEAVALGFPRLDVDADDARRMVHGIRLPAAGLGPGPVGVFGPGGELLALAEDRGDVLRSLCVFVG